MAFCNQPIRGDVRFSTFVLGGGLFQSSYAAGYLRRQLLPDQNGLLGTPKPPPMGASRPLFSPVSAQEIFLDNVSNIVLYDKCQSVRSPDSKDVSWLQRMQVPCDGARPILSQIRKEPTDYPPPLQ
jgi:hypothetical protein